MTLAIAQFGHAIAGRDHILRPGGYSVIRDAAGRVAVVLSKSGMHLPGGGQDPGESPEAAAIREAGEECGLVIRIERALGVADQLVHAVAEDRAYRKRESFFLASVLGSDARLQLEGDELRWVAPAAALSGLTEEAQRWALRQVVEPAAG